jgi:hypothetical protein
MRVSSFGKRERALSVGKREVGPEERDGELEVRAG